MRLLCVATISMVVILAPSPTASTAGGWNDPNNNQYHIQTDEGPERYFRYQTDSGQYRKEKRLEDGTVVGSYGWIDSNGYLRLRDYIADDAGYRILRTKNVYVGRNRPISQAIKAAKKVPSSAGILTDTKSYLPPKEVQTYPSSTLAPPLFSSTIATPIVATTQRPEEFYLASPTPPTVVISPKLHGSTAQPVVVISPKRPVYNIPSSTAQSVYNIQSSTPSSIYDIPSSTISPIYNIPSSTPQPIYNIPSSTPQPIYNIPSPTPQSIYNIPSSTPQSIYNIPSSTPSYDINSNSLDYYSGSPQYEHYSKPSNPYVYHNGPTYPIDRNGNSYLGYNTLGNGYDPQYPKYDGVSVTNDGFRYYIPRAYHEEQNDGDKKTGSFGYVDPFGIRRVIYYNAGVNGFQHRKNNRYVGLDATPYDPRPYR